MAGVVRGQPPLVGRAAPVALLLDALEAAGRREPSAVVVSGDAGVGKTRLLTELVERAQDRNARVGVGHCSDLGGVGLPYLPFTEALRSLGSASDGGDHGVRSVLEQGAGATGDGGRLQLFDAVAGALAAAGEDAEGGALLVLEDLHWADRSTRELLSFLLPRLRDERLLVVASYRSDDLHRRHPLRPLLAELARLPAVRRLDLAPFTAGEMTQYLEVLSGSALPAATSHRILERSEGNAYYAGELLEASRTGGGGSRDGLPTALADVVLSRLEALGPAELEVVRVAAVGGRRVTHPLLRAASGVPDDELEAALREAVAHHVLFPDGPDGYAFRHALLHEAVYADLLPGERSRLHAAYARAIDASAAAGAPLASAADLAHHRRESHDLPGALLASVLAAGEAERLHAPSEAWQQLERALPLWDVVPEADRLTGTTLVALTLRAAALASRAGELARAAALAQAVVDRLGPGAPAVLAASAHQQLATHLVSSDEPVRALGAAQEAVRLAGSDDAAGASAVWGESTAARALLELDRVEEARPHVERARAGAVRLGLAAAEADALISLAGYEAADGRAEAAEELLARAAQRARDAGDPATELRASYNLTAGTYDRGDLAGALALLDPAVEACAAAGLTWSPYGLELRALLATARYVAGDWDASVRAARLARSRPPDAMAARLAVPALLVAVARGEQDAESSVRQLAAEWHHDPVTALGAAGCAAELLRWQRQPAAALEVLERALSDVDDRWQPWYLAGIRLAATGLGAAGDLAEAAPGPGAGVRATADRLLRRAHDTASQGRPRNGVLGPEGRAWLARAVVPP